MSKEGARAHEKAQKIMGFANTPAFSGKYLLKIELRQKLDIDRNLAPLVWEILRGLGFKIFIYDIQVPDIKPKELQ